MWVSTIRLPNTLYKSTKYIRSNCFPALLLIKSAGLLLICEFLEIFTLHLMWITAILYLRHLVPNKYITCGQALPIIAHFCLGRSIGVLLGSLAFTEYPDNFNRVHEGFTVAAAVIAIVYFVAYHFYLKPKAAPTQLPPYPAPSTVVQSECFDALFNNATHCILF